MDLDKIERFMRENALNLGMLLLYLWIVACGVFFFFRYYYRSKPKPAEKDSKGKWKRLVTQLNELNDLMKQSDDYVEEVETKLEQIKKDGEDLAAKQGRDPKFDQLVQYLENKLDLAYGRLDSYASQEKMKKRILRGSSGPAPKADSDELM